MKPKLAFLRGNVAPPVPQKGRTAIAARGRADVPAAASQPQNHLAHQPGKPPP
jgi:hypothetical protein